MFPPRPMHRRGDPLRALYRGVYAAAATPDSHSATIPRSLLAVCELRSRRAARRRLQSVAPLRRATPGSQRAPTECRLACGGGHPVVAIAEGPTHPEELCGIPPQARPSLQSLYGAPRALASLWQPQPCDLAPLSRACSSHSPDPKASAPAAADICCVEETLDQRAPLSLWTTVTVAVPLLFR